MATHALRGCALLFLLLGLHGCTGMGYGGTTYHPSDTRRLSVRDYLVNGAHEAEGYGLYSYVLLKRAPERDDRERVAALLAEYLRAISHRDNVGSEAIDRFELNVTYLPVESTPPHAVEAVGAGSTDPETDAAVAWIIRNYDYDRARVMLAAFEGTEGDGPYLVSQKAAVTTSGADDRYLLQDLSNAEPRLVRLWMKGFLQQVKKERFWDRDTMFSLHLGLRELVAKTGAMVPSVASAVVVLREFAPAH